MEEAQDGQDNGLSQEVKKVSEINSEKKISFILRYKDKPTCVKMDMDDLAVHSKFPFRKKDKPSISVNEPQHERQVFRKKKKPIRRRFNISDEGSNVTPTESTASNFNVHDLSGNVTSITTQSMSQPMLYGSGFNYFGNVPSITTQSMPQPMLYGSGFNYFGREMPFYPPILQSSVNSLSHNVIDFTHLALSNHIREPFVRTEAMGEAMNRLDQYNVVIISGLAGSGKTVMGNQLLLDLYQKDPTCLIKINDPNEFRIAISTKSRCVIFIDDIFGKTGLDTLRLEQWLPMLERVVSLVKCDICKIIITCRTCILKEAKEYLQEWSCPDLSDTSLFSSSHILDLSIFRLSDEEKISLIRCHTASLPQEMKMDEQELLSIYRAYIGFPLFCKLISNRKSMHPSRTKNEELLTAYTVRVIDRINRTEKLKYITLVFMALSDSTKLHKNISVKLSSNEEALLRLLANLCFIQFHTGFTDRLIDAAECLSETFVKYQSDQDTFELTDTCVHDAVCLSFGKRHPQVVLQLCTDEFIQEFLTTNTNIGYESVPCLYVPPHQYNLLAKRLLGILSSRFDAVKQMKVLTERKFVDFFFTFLFESNQLETFLTETIKKPLETELRNILFYCEDRPVFLSMILMQLSGVYDQEIKKVMKYFLSTQNHECVKVIHKYTRNRFKSDLDLKSDKDEADLDDGGFTTDKHNFDSTSGAAALTPHSKMLTDFMKINVDTEQHQYLCEIKVSSERYPRLQFIQQRLEKAFGPKSNFAGKFDLVKKQFHFDVGNLWDTSSLYVFSHNLLSMDNLGFFFEIESEHMQKLTRPVSKRCDINFAVNRPTAKIIIVDVRENSQADKGCYELTAESIQVIQLMVYLMAKEELAKAIFVINTDSIPDIGTIDDAIIINKIAKCIRKVDTFPKNVKVSQYNCFLLDEFQLPKRISECLEFELERMITRFSDEASKANLQADAAQLEKCFESAKNDQKENVSLLAKIILSRYQSINSFFLKDEKLHVCVDKEDAVDEKYLKYETGYEIKIDTNSNTGEIMKHIRQGHKLHNHERNSYGTLGCFGNMGDNILVGYTCEHVVRDAEVVYTEDGVRFGITSEMTAVNGNDSIADALIDIAAFEIDTGRLNECEKGLYCPKGNAAPITVFQGRDFSKIQHKIFFKWGATTDLKHCMFDREQSRRFPNSRRRNHFRREYIIRSITDESCGEPGDSGALVCYHNLIENSINAIFFYIGSNGDGTGEYVCCLAAEALDALHTKGKEKHELGDYVSFALVRS